MCCENSGQSPQAWFVVSFNVVCVKFLIKSVSWNILVWCSEEGVMLHLYIQFHFSLQVLSQVSKTC